MHMPLLKKLQIENKLLKEDLNSITPSVPGSGEDIILNNTANARFKTFKVSGNTIQDGEPSPEAPVEIRNCGDNINEFDGNSTLINDFKSFYAKESVYSSNNGENIFQHYTQNIRCKAYFLMKKGDIRTFSVSNEAYIFQLVRYANLEGIVQGTIPTTENNRVATYAAMEDCYIYLSLMKNDATAFTDEEAEELKNSIKVEKGTKATSWSPYMCGSMGIKITDDAEQEKSIVFPLEEGQELCGLKVQDKSVANFIDSSGQAWICDYLADDGIHKRTLGVKLTTENVFFSGYNTDTNGFLNVIFGIESTKIMKTPINKCGLCTIAPYSTENETSTEYEALGFYVMKNQTSIKIHIPKTRLGLTVQSTTTEINQAIKDLLNSNDVYLLLGIEEELIIPYSEEQQKAYDQIKNAKSYKGTTHILSEDEIKPILEVEAFADMSNSINTKEKIAEEIKEESEEANERFE